MECNQCARGGEKERERKRERKRIDRSDTIACGPRVRSMTERESEKTARPREKERERGGERKRERE